MKNSPICSVDIEYNSWPRLPWVLGIPTLGVTRLDLYVLWRNETEFIVTCEGPLRGHSCHGGALELDY